MASMRAGACILQLGQPHWKMLDGLDADVGRTYRVANDGSYRVNHDGSTVVLRPQPNPVVIECFPHQVLSALMLASFASSDMGEGEIKLTVVIIGIDPKTLYFRACAGVIYDAEPWV